MYEYTRFSRRTMLRLSGAAGAAVLYGGRRLSHAAEPAADDIQHYVVFQEDGRFGGWPANHGMWNWGEEIICGYVEADHEDRSGHTYARSTARHMFVRSLDGGETWSIQDGYESGITGWAHNHRIEQGKAAEPVDCPGGIDFEHPNFAFAFTRANNHEGPSNFYYSTNRAHSWNGPFRFPNLDTHGVPARTDYIVDGSQEMLVFLTAAKSDGREGRVFCARTTDGAATWERVAWIGPEPDGFAIMPASVRLSSSKILTTIRHRGDGGTWITSYLSEDNGGSWEQLGDPVTNNINSPPALVRLPDGRVVLAYVDRRDRNGGAAVCAKIGSDDGRTWSDEIVLRGDEGATGDVGYPRLVQRPDGKLVVVYYWNHARDEDKPPYRYIAATIWDLGWQ